MPFPHRWRPFWKTENALLALVKLPVYLVVICVFLTLRGLEIVLYELVYRILMWSFLRGLPLPPGAPRKFAFRLGTASLVSKVQLDKIQRKVCLDGHFIDMAQARRVFVRGIHTANLLSQPQFERLMDHAPCLLNNNQLASRLTDILKERVVKSSVPGELGVLSRLTITNTYESGAQASRTAVWGRCLVGAQQAIAADGKPSPKGPIVAAILNVSEDIRKLAGEYNKFPCLLHWYTVTRRWFVDLTMLVWWDLSAEKRHMVDPAYLVRLFTQFSKTDRYNRLSLGQSISMINTAVSLGQDHSKLVTKYIRGEEQRPTVMGAAAPFIDSLGLPDHAVSASYVEGTVEDLREELRKGELKGGLDERNWLNSTEHNVEVLKRAIMAKYEEFADNDAREQHGQGWAMRLSAFASAAMSGAAQAAVSSNTGSETREFTSGMFLRAAFRRGSLTVSSTASTETGGQV